VGRGPAAGTAGWRAAIQPRRFPGTGGRAARIMAAHRLLRPREPDLHLREPSAALSQRRNSRPAEGARQLLPVRSCRRPQRIHASSGGEAEQDADAPVRHN
jgi:hypothetical protein